MRLGISREATTPTGQIKLKGGGAALRERAFLPKEQVDRRGRVFAGSNGQTHLKDLAY